MLFEIKVEDFPLSKRCVSLLLAAGFKTESDFSKAKEKDIRNLPGFGPVLLAELKLFLKGRKIKFVKEVKEKKVPKYHPRARELAKLLLPKGEINFAMETQAAGKLLEVYSFESLARVKLPEHVTSLRWLLSGLDGWADRFVNSFAPMRLLETQIETKVEEKTEIEEVEYKPVSKPMDLRTFLGLKK